MTHIRNEKGVSLLELLVVLLILSIIVGGLNEMLAGGLKSSMESRGKTKLINDIDYATDRIINATRGTGYVLIPLNAKPVRDILAIGAMVDNDNDGAVDEDWSSDLGNNGMPGLGGFDDDGDGLIDENGGGMKWDDDEDLKQNEDKPKNGLDDDGDGNYDEEFWSDINGDGCAGICLVNDDNDIDLDEGGLNNDDEDNMVDEDPVDPLIFYVKNGALYEKRILWNPNNNTNDITDSKLIDNVSQFRIERLMGQNGKTLLKIKIEVSDGRGSSVMLESAVLPRMLPAVKP